MRFLILITISMLASASGCASFQQLDRQERLENGLTLVLPGVEGEGLLSRNMAEGLESGGVETAIEVHDWTSGQPLRSLEHLVSYEQNLSEADRLTQRIVRYRTAYPDRPLHLVGHSGGAALIAMAVRQLPEGMRVNRIVLLAPALSMSFPIAETANRADLVYHFRSPFDIQLTAGTTLFGSIDRQFGPSAGSYGFAANTSSRLIEIPYHVSMMRDGHPGGHNGYTSARFIRNWVAPMLNSQPLPEDPSLDRSQGPSQGP